MNFKLELFETSQRGYFDMARKKSGTERAQFGTKLGVIAATVGSAVGLGNIWRFPYEVGNNGGAAFVLVYVGCVLLLGIPLMVAEFIIGRSTHQNARQAVRTLAPGKHLSWLTFMYFFTTILIIGFYSVVASWIIHYLFQALLGHLLGHSATEYTDMFLRFLQNPYQMVMWTIIFLLINQLVLLGGIQKGIERVSNVMMPIFFALLLIFAVRALMLPGAKEGLTFLLKPDFSCISSSLVINAFGQAFMSLSLGVGTLITYSSYFSDDTQLLRTSSTIVGLDTLVAMLAGLIIFPILFTFGGEVAAGPKLVFEVLPNIFQQMSGSYFLAVGFFLLLFFASITSTISMSEVCVTYLTEERHKSRTKAAAILTTIVMVLAILCALSYNVLNHVTLLGMTIFDWCEFASSNVLMPLGGLFSALLVGWVVKNQVVEEQLHGSNGRLSIWGKTVYFLLRYITPLLILLIFFYGLLA